jgi:hypothetical protein
MIFVNVKGPVGREIFASGNYDASLGTAPVTIPRQAGTHTFEAVQDDLVDYRGKVENVADGMNVDLTLRPVRPPEPTS